MKGLINKIYSFKSHWYYWYTGQKRIAITSVLISSFICTCIYLAPQLVHETILFTSQELHSDDFEDSKTLIETLNILLKTLLVKSAFIILLTVFLGEIAIWLAIAYVVFIRNWIPDILQTFLGLQTTLDGIVLTYLLSTVIAALFINRVSTYFTAKYFGVLPIKTNV